MFKKCTSAIILIAFVITVVPTASAGERSNRDRNFTVMTRNLDAGSDFGFILKATDPTAILIGVTGTYLEVLQSNIPARADGVAAEIQALQPDIVGLQEVTTILN